MEVDKSIGECERSSSRPPNHKQADSLPASRDADFQQAKSEDRKPQFLQIVAKPKSKAKPPPKLTRVAFRVSRLMEFCTKRELQNQTGHRYMTGRWSSLRS